MPCSCFFYVLVNSCSMNEVIKSRNYQIGLNSGLAYSGAHADDLFCHISSLLLVATLRLLHTVLFNSRR